MDQITLFLEGLWLTAFEQEVFVACTKYPNSSISSLVRILEKPRSTINDAIKKMIDKWYIVQKQKSRWWLYSSVGYDWLESLIETKKMKLSQQANWLKSIKLELSKLEINDFNFTNIEYYKWTQAITLLYNKINKSDEMRSIYNVDKSIKYSNYTMEQLAWNPLKNKKMTREIIWDTKLWEEYASYFEWKKDLQVKLVPKEAISWFHADQIITDTHFYFITFGEEIIGVEIKNKIFVESQKIIFDLLRDNF